MNESAGSTAPPGEGLFRDTSLPALGGACHDDRDAPTAPMSWMERLKRVFAIDLSICPDCAGRLHVVADVIRPDIIQKVLEHVARQRAPPEFSAISGMATVH